MGRVGEIWWRPRARRLLLMAAAAGSIVAGAASAREFSDWGAPVRADSLSGSSAQVNTPSSDGCPILSPYDNDLYMASNRPGSVLNGSNLPSLDIWIAHRNGSGWDTPVNAGPQINTAADEFCPDPARGNRLFFVRRLSSTNTDIYLSKKLPNGFTTPQPLPRGDEAINSPAEEWSPSYFEAGGREFLYFSSTRQSSPGHDIFYSVNFGPAQFAPGGVNSSASDARPNVRHDGLEIVWDSTRTGSQLTDIWTASRSSVDAPWGAAVQLGNGINSAAGESRASLSWDGTVLMFGSTRDGTSDIFVSRREPLTGRH
jgi:WD40-like Beta Propeller Repeat